MCYSSGQARGTLWAPSHTSLTLGSPGGCSSKKTFFEKRKILEKTGERPSVTGGLRTGDRKKFESIRINLRDLVWSQVFPRDPGFLHPWIPGTRPGTTPGIPSKTPTDTERNLRGKGIEKVRKLINHPVVCLCCLLLIDKVRGKDKTYT